MTLHLLEKGDNLVYKYVPNNYYPIAEKIYLKNIKTREPKIFRIDSLLKNGHGLVTNIKNIKPIVGVTLWNGYYNDFWDYTRLEPTLKGFSWSKEEKCFELPKKFKRKIKRTSKVYITIGDKEYTV